MLTVIGTWFGYVGMCMVAPDATCRPLLAFLALGAAAAVGLTLLVVAYKAAQARAMPKTGEQHGRTRSVRPRTRIEPTVLDKNIAARNVAHSRLRAAV